jgi:regulator of sigma E protease
MYSVVSAIVVLGVLIFVHELGHFVVAKLSGVRVLVFSLGFGPKLCGVRLGETEYILSAIPLGGYVKMLGEGKGEEEDEEAELSEEEQQGSYAHKGPWRRMAIIVAGPLTNILFAALVFAVVYLFGVPSLVPVVGEVNYEMPAYSAGFRPGDRIISIDGKKIETWDELSSTIRSSGGR